jgi:hypothetical protein
MQKFWQSWAEGVVVVWTSATGEQSMALPAHSQSVAGVAWSPDGKRLATIGSDDPAPDDPAPVPGTIETWSRIKVWDARTGRKITEWRAHAGGHCVTWSPDGKLLASLGSDDTFNGRRVGEQHRADGKPGLMPNGKREHFYTIRIWDAATGREVSKISRPFGKHAIYSGKKRSGPYFENLNWVGWSPDGRRLAASGEWVHVWNTRTWQEILTIPPDPKDGHGHYQVAWKSDSKHIAVAKNDIKVWEVSRGKVVLHLAGHSRGIVSVAWSPKGRRLVSAGRDDLLTFWDTVSGEQVLSIAGKFTVGASVAWSPVGRSLATSSQREVKLLDTRQYRFWLPSVAHLHNRLARGWLDPKDQKFRDPTRAVESARKAVELAPRIGMYWATLGRAHFQAGNWKDAVRALERSMELRWGGDGTVRFCLAMAAWRLGDKKKARKWYNEGVLWMKPSDLGFSPQISRSQKEGIRRLRAKAAELLRIKEPPVKRSPSRKRKEPAPGK